jgi:hypothetical protein
MIYPEHETREGGMSGQELFLGFGPESTTLIVGADFINTTSDTAFLLPLRSVPDDISDADVALWIALESETAPLITIETIQDIDEETGLGCACTPNDGAKGGDDAGTTFGSGEPMGDDGGGIEVHDRGETATYDYVIVGGEMGSTLAQWLTDEGFGVPDDYANALDAYTSDDWMFLAARVKTEAVEDGSLAPLELTLPPMQPQMVEIPFALASFSLPPGRELAVTLYVAGPDMVVPADYPIATINPDDLKALSPDASNYSQLFDDAVSDAAWVLEYSRGDWRPEHLYGWWEQHEYEEDLGADPTWLWPFAERLGFASGRISRLTTRLGPEDLHDMRLEEADPLDVSRDFHVEYHVQAGRSAASPTGPGNLIFLVPLLFLRRRR